MTRLNAEFHHDVSSETLGSPAVLQLFSMTVCGVFFNRFCFFCNRRHIPSGSTLSPLDKSVMAKPSEKQLHQSANGRVTLTAHAKALFMTSITEL